MKRGHVARAHSEHSLSPSVPRQLILHSGAKENSRGQTGLIKRAPVKSQMVERVDLEMEI